MTLTIGQTFVLALVPPYAERLGERAVVHGSNQWQRAARAVCFLRNRLYIGVALAAIGIIGSAVMGGYLFKGVALLGIVVVSLMSAKLYPLACRIHQQWTPCCQQHGNLLN